MVNSACVETFTHRHYENEQKHKTGCDMQNETLRCCLTPSTYDSKPHSLSFLTLTMIDTVLCAAQKVVYIVHL